MDSRDAAIHQLSCCCENSCTRDEVLYYIETLEKIIRHLVLDTDNVTENQKQALSIIMERTTDYD